MLKDGRCLKLSVLTDLQTSGHSFQQTFQFGLAVLDRLAAQTPCRSIATDQTRTGIPIGDCDAGAGNVLAIALANKLARIAWAVLHKGRAFECVKTNASRPA